jgi:hypothetical protein
VNGEHVNLLLHYCISILLHWNIGLLIHTQFLAGCHYNEEEISRHMKINIGYWLVQMNGNKFATGQILRKPVEVVKGRILAG